MRALNGWACLLKNHKREKANNVLSRFFRDLEFPFKAVEAVLKYNEKGRKKFPVRCVKI